MRELNESFVKFRKRYKIVTSEQFFDGIAELIDQYGGDKVMAAARLCEKTNQKHRFISKNPNDFSNRLNAAPPKLYKGYWITQDYSNDNKGRIYARIRKRVTSL